MALADDLPADEVRELLQALVRNACVNDGTPTSGGEERNAATLRAYLEGSGVDLWSHEPLPGRTSLLARLPGSDPDAPTIGLMGHTDVVPVTPDAWTRDPFAAELVDGEVWGRGTIDMLNLTASMAVALRHLATGRVRPRADVLLLAVADEEAGGFLGAGWLAEHAWDEVRCDVVLTESGGLLTDTPSGPRLVFAAAEKGIAWRRIVVGGRSSHGSRPYGADNALVRAAEVVRRLAVHRGGARITTAWRAWVEALGLPDDQRAALLDEARVLDAIDGFDDPEARSVAHALTHTTWSPNVVRGGTKTNVVPDEVVIEVDVRTLPGTSDADVDAELAAVLAGLDNVRWEPALATRPATASRTDTRWWELLTELAGEAHPEATVLPRTTTGGTDATFFRARGVPAYGAGLFSDALDLDSFSARFHGPDERVDLASLGLSAAFFREFVLRSG